MRSRGGAVQAALKVAGICVGCVGATFTVVSAASSHGQMPPPPPPGGAAHSVGGALLGNGLLVVQCVGGSAFQLLNKRLTGRYPSIMVASVGYCAGTLLLMLIVVPLRGRHTAAWALPQQGCYVRGPRMGRACACGPHPRTAAWPRVGSATSAHAPLSSLHCSPAFFGRHCLRSRAALPRHTNKAPPPSSTRRALIHTRPHSHPPSSTPVPSFTPALIHTRPLPPAVRRWTQALAYAVFLASAFNYFAYAWAARRSSASHVTAFFPLQVVFAAVFQVGPPPPRCPAALWPPPRCRLLVASPATSSLPTPCLVPHAAPLHASPSCRSFSCTSGQLPSSSRAPR